MISLGLDISATGTGVVFLEKIKGRKDPVVLFADQVPPANAAKVGRWDRVDMIGHEIATLIEAHPPSVVTVEGYGQVSHGGVQSFVKVVEVGTMIKMLLWANDLKWQEVPPQSLKKFVTGKGKLPSGAKGKKVMIEHVARSWGYVTKNHNIADAFGLAMFGFAKVGAVPVPPDRLESLDKVKDMDWSWA